MPTLLITGANRGIGLEAAAQLASLGKFDRIILTARTAEKGEAARTAQAWRGRPVRPGHRPGPPARRLAGHAREGRAPLEAFAGQHLPTKGHVPAGYAAPHGPYYPPLAAPSGE